MMAIPRNLTALSCLLLIALQVATAVDVASNNVLGRRSLQQWGQQWGQPSWGGGSQWGRKDSGSGSSTATSQAGATTGRSNKGNVQSLSALTGPMQSFSSVAPQPITPTSAPASTLAKGLRSGGNARAAAQSLAQTYSSNAEEAATAVASAATDSSSGGTSSAVAEAVAETTVNHPNVAPGLLAKSADLAVNRGQTSAFANTMADAFSVAKRRSYVPQFTQSVANAISQGGAASRYAYGEAIATAIAQGGDSQAAVAEATAAAFCEGGSTAQAWSSAYAVALSKDSKGCLVLNQAKAMAQAQCGAGAAKAASQAEASSLVLGFCGLLNLIPTDGMSWSGGNSGSNSFSG